MLLFEPLPCEHVIRGFMNGEPSLSDTTRTGALGGGSRFHISIVRKVYVALSNLRNVKVILSILRNAHVSCNYLFKAQFACH